MIQRYKITLEYDGTAFHGWQKQNNSISVQSTITDALYQLTSQNIEIHGAGRTDAGVHAISQVAHFDIPQIIPLHQIRNALNFYLNKYSVSITNAEYVTQDFHARFSAKSRTYKYLIFNRNSPTSLYKNRVWTIYKILDIEKMLLASRDFIGTHDLTSFRSIHCQAHNPVRPIYDINIIKQDDHLISITIHAKSFLHNQVRIMVGTLAYIGLGKYSTNIIPWMLQQKDRTKSGITAPPYGLYLYKILY